MAKRKRGGPGGWLMHLIFKLMVLAAAIFLIGLGALCLAEKYPPKATGDSQAIIVLGAQVYSDGTPSPQLELRLEAALAAWQQGPQPVIVCGAQGTNEPAPEGQVMRAWLISRGVPESQIQADVTSRNTEENLQNALALLPPGATAVTVVTSDYHLPRALVIARDLGLQPNGIGSPCKPEYWVKNHFREVLAWGKYLGKKIGVLK